MSSALRGTALAVLVAASLSACGEAARSGARTTVETLATGVIHVTNPLPTRDEANFELAEELRIGRLEGEGPDVFGDIAGDGGGPQGNIYVLDFSAREVRVFDGEGVHHWTVGSDGEGPGELSFPVGLTFDDLGLLWSRTGATLIEIRGPTLGDLRISASFEDEGFEEVVQALCDVSGAECALSATGVTMGGA